MHAGFMIITKMNTNHEYSNWCQVIYSITYIFLVVIHATNILLSHHFFISFFSPIDDDDDFIHIPPPSILPSCDSYHSGPGPGPPNALLLRIFLPRRQTRYLQPLAESPEATPRFPRATAQSRWAEDSYATSGEGPEVVELVKRKINVIKNGRDRKSVV